MGQNFDQAKHEQHFLTQTKNFEGECNRLGIHTTHAPGSMPLPLSQMTYQNLHRGYYEGIS